MRVLNYDELQAFSKRTIEWTTKDRLYCAEPTCSKFIPPFSIQNKHSTCPECHQQTHLPCRSFAHPGVDCPMDDALHGVLAMANAENWRQCFNCQTMVELQHGCNHITCRYVDIAILFSQDNKIYQGANCFQAAAMSFVMLVDWFGDYATAYFGIRTD